MLTLLDIARRNGSSTIVGLIEENVRYSPELSLLGWEPTPGTTLLTSKRTSYPKGGFVLGGGGIAGGQSTFAAQLTQMFPYLGIVQIPVTVGMAFDQGLARLEMDEASGVMKQTLLNMGSQIWNGTANLGNTYYDGTTVFSDPNGFPGVKQYLPNNGNGPFGNATLVINAGGTTANTASSIYAIQIGEQDVHGLIGLNSSFELAPFRDQQINDANGNPMPARVSHLVAWPGLFLGNKNCARRIINVTADAGHTCTDALLGQMVDSFPNGFKPTYIFYSRRSRGQLRQSRTVTLFGQGADRPNQPNIAPLPTEFDGIPLIATDAIPDTDPIE